MNYIDKIEEAKFELNCNYCDGVGRVENDKAKTVHDPQWITCDYCEGKGHCHGSIGDAFFLIISALEEREGEK